MIEAVHAGDETVGLYVIDPALWGPAGAARRAFLVGCLRSLDDAMDGRLVIRHGDPRSVVPAVAAEVEATAVHCAGDFGPYGTARDGEVDGALAADGRELAPVGSPYAVEPGTIRTGSGTPYQVFTPFKRAWLAHGWPAPVRAPGTVTWADGVRSDPWPAAPDVAAALPEPGEAAAKQVARRFFDHDLDRYDQQRDRPDVDATSRLSPYLRWGCIHPRQLLTKLDGSDAHSTFRSELAWREFYADVLHHRPDSARRSYQPAMAAMELDKGAVADERFAAWAEGRTGFPLVDAGMRQLAAEGWMHNRVRMVVASFLVKDLHLDWTRGARHFMDQLVDGDLASNQHGWQWTAGTGTDASPYFRVFNPLAQAKRFDPAGDYVRRWVPELRGVSGAAVHEPDRLAGGRPDGYPAPIVDHATERDEALRRYAVVRGRGS